MHAVIVETDPETAEIKILKYAVVHDCGHLINPMIVEGQIHGGVAQGVGGALYERMAYDESGQLLNASFMDFLMPYVTEVPDGIDIDHLETPSPLNPLGIKGAGEAGRDPVRRRVRRRHRGRRGLRDHRRCRSRRPSCSPCRQRHVCEEPHEDRRSEHPAAPRRRRSGTRCSTRAVLVATIPGCERLDATGENAYDMTVTAGVAAIKGTYAGHLRAVGPRRARVAGDAARGAGAPGTIDATVQRRLLAEADGATTSRLRGRRGRRRHGRRRRPADADLGLEADGGRVLRQRRQGAHRATLPRRPPLLAGARRPAARRRARSSPRPPTPPASPPRTTSSRASPSAPAWCCSASSPGPLRAAAVSWRFPGSTGDPCRGVLQRPSGSDAADRRMTDLTVDSTARESWRPGSREISARELLDLHLARIAERNPELNAIVSPRRGARPRRRARGRRGAGTAERGPLHGLPFAFKDTHDVAGWRTTYGSPLFADHVPDHDDLIVERIRARRGGADRQDQRAGVRGRVATPSTGSSAPPSTRSTRRGPPAARAGERRARSRPGWCRWPTAPTWAARCATRRRSAASSGCGRRLGRVPEWPHRQPVGDHLGRRPDGPQRRRPRAAALGDRRPGPAGAAGAGRPGLDVRAAAVTGSLAGLRVALSADLGGAFEVDAEVAAVVEARARRVRRGRRPRVRPRTRTWPPADDTFRTLRAWHFQAGFGALLAEHPDDVQAVARRQHPRRRVAHRRRRRPRLRAAHRAGRDDARQFFEAYDVLVLPVSQVPPFPADQEYPDRDQRPADGDLPRLDALGVLHHRHRLPGDLGARRAAPPTGCRSASRSSRRTGADRCLLEVAAAFEALGAGLIIHREAVDLWMNAPVPVEDTPEDCGAIENSQKCWGFALAHRLATP